MSSFQNSCLLQVSSHAVVIAAVCGFALSCCNKHHLEGSICYSKTFIYLSTFIVPSKTFKRPIQHAHMHPHTIRDAGFCTEYWWHAGRSPSSLTWRTWRPWFPTRMSNLDSSEFWHRGHEGASGPCSHMASFLHDRALVGICRWHGGLCLPCCVCLFSNVNDRIMPMSDAVFSEVREDLQSCPLRT